MAGIAECMLISLTYKKRARSVEMVYLVEEIGLMISSILFWSLLIIYPMLVLYNFYKNKRWVYFGLLCIPLAIGLCSVLWAFYRYEIVGGICTIVYIIPFYICIFINIICGIVHLVSYLTKRRVKEGICS